VLHFIAYPHLHLTVEAVEALIEGGANVNAQNNLTGGSPLHMVVQSSKGSSAQTLAVTDALIQAGADLNLADNYGNLPAHHATSNPDPDLSKVLVQRLQPVASPLFQALADGDASAVEQLLSSNHDGSLVASKYCGHTALQVCVSDLLTMVTKSLEEEDISTQETTTQKTSQLLAILKTLLTAGSDPNVGSVGAEDEEDEPPLHRICCALRQAYKQNSQGPGQGLVVDVMDLLQEVAGLLLKAGATVETVTSQLLHEAARRNETNMARFLVETLHVDPNGKGRQGMTPLQFAARSGRMEILHYFLSLSSMDVQAKDDRGQTALDAARVNQKEDVVAALEAHISQHQ
jgi:ankyrin repeat protein